MDTGGTFCPIRPKCRRDGDLMKQPPCNNNCPAGSEYIQDPSNTTPGAPRILNPRCLVNNAAAADPYSGCSKNDPGGTSNLGALLVRATIELRASIADCAVKTVAEIRILVARIGLTVGIRSVAQFRPVPQLHALSKLSFRRETN
jgi:hypothetical protein